MSTLLSQPSLGQLSPPSAAPTSPPVRPESIGSTPSVIPGVINFARIDTGLYRGNQPTPEGFGTLTQLGIHHDIDLRVEYNDDADLRPSRPWYYAYAPTGAKDISTDLVAAVVKTMMTATNYPLYVHCLHGSDRTGCVCAVYRIINDRWSNQAALNEMHLFGFHAQYTNISSFISGLDPADMRSRIDRASALAFRPIA